MLATIIAALISSGATLAVCLINNINQQNRTDAQIKAQQTMTREQLQIQHAETTKLMDYRLGELEKKVEKHNNVIERTFMLERDNKTAFKRIDELRGDIERIEDHVF